MELISVLSCMFGLYFVLCFIYCRDESIGESRQLIPRPDYAPLQHHGLRRDPPPQTADHGRVLPPSEDAKRRTYKIDPNFTDEYFW